MSDPRENAVAPHLSLNPPQTSPRPVIQPPQQLQVPPPPVIQSTQPSQVPRTQQPVADFSTWDKIRGDEQQRFYDERDCLHPNLTPVSEKLRNREENDVVIFNYSSKPNYPHGVDREGSIERSSSENEEQFDIENDRFCLVPKEKLIESTEFDQIINLDPGELDSRISRGTRLGIVDFPQCYDTRNDDQILDLFMVKKLGLTSEGGTAFKDSHSNRVHALPGRKRFRTGISLRAPFQNSSDNGFTLFVSFPYFGKSSSGITLGSERESVGLLDFKRLGVHVHDDRTREFVEEAGAGDILVHQARYMVFDNHTMATFRSKEDKTKDQVPLHRFQERIGAFRALVHMIANRTSTDLESWVFGKLQTGLCELEKEIDQAISNAGVQGGNQALPGEYADVQTLLISLNRLSAQLFASISVVERQIAILHDLDSVFSTCYRTETRIGEMNSPRKQSPFHRNAAPIPIFQKNPEQIWPNTLDTIKEVVQERKSFIRKIKDLIENMDIRRKILSVFLKSNQAKSAPSEKTAEETKRAMERSEQTARETKSAIERTKEAIEDAQETLVQQSQTLSGFTIVTTAFLPLSFCTSYFGMNNITEFNRHTISVRDFWLTTGPVCAGVILLTVIIIIWKRPEMASLRGGIGKALGLSDPGGKAGDRKRLLP
ncbi:hypothetical protein L873DRAFT_1841387 [Choiromyces venosus 120613-1]|uniref:Cora-domain-containing protein n=1 Tax=Choiromyces venosus 120613-1 TaxID=1336337 RepID=A0A3N4KAU2_9PEZI|nr:hypothetical protein L873DRAFT_1841387 [Choiromyces venosus 120613-1]